MRWAQNFVFLTLRLDRTVRGKTVENMYYPAFRPDSSRQDSWEYVLVFKKEKNSLCDVGVQTVVKTVDFLLVSFRVNFAVCFRFVYKLQGNVTVKSYSVNSQSESTVGEKSETVSLFVYFASKNLQEFTFERIHPEEKQLKINKNHIESIRNLNESLVMLKFLILIWHNINLKLIILIWKQCGNNIDLRLKECCFNKETILI